MVGTPDFTQPPPKVQTLAEAQALIRSAVGECAADCSAGRGAVSRGRRASRAVGPELTQLLQAPFARWARCAPATSEEEERALARGQTGHAGHSREFLLPEQVDAVIACRPAKAVCGCGTVLPVAETPCWRHQMIELPAVKAQVTEYQGFASRARVVARCIKRQGLPAPPPLRLSRQPLSRRAPR